MKLWVMLVCLILFFGAAGVYLPAAAGEAQGKKAVNPDETEVYCRAVIPTPVYSAADIPSLYYNRSTSKPSLKLDEKGHLRELEFIALEGSKFKLKNEVNIGSFCIYEVETEEYVSEKPLFIDSRYVVRCSAAEPEREKIMPGGEEILSAMKTMVGNAYRWGGNYHKGIVEQLEFYPLGDIEQREEFLDNFGEAWILGGVDCSGLLYEAANGATPRNTSELVAYGEAVDIAGLSVGKIAAELKPLDLIVWNGHVVIVFDGENTIESRPRYPDSHKGGVRILPLYERLGEIMKTRKPVNDYYNDLPAQKRFVVRRFID